MEFHTELAWAAAKAFLIALILTPIIRDISRSYNFVDRPGFRKIHAHPVPRIGGIPIAIAYGLSLIAFHSGGPWIPANSVAWKILPGAVVIFATGLLDDFFNLKALTKLAGQVVAAIVVFWCGLRIDTVARIDLPIWLSFVLTVFWILLCANALNLIDGLDGLCAGMGFLSTLTLFGVAILHGDQSLAFATFPLAGALLGFLCYNFYPATVFLGDSGALLIGFLLGCYGMISTQKTATLLSVAVPILALSIPLLDVSLSVLRRFLRNRSIFSADQGHIHHRLLERGLSPRRAVLVLYLVTALAAAFALLLSRPILGRYQGFVILAFSAAAWLGVRQLRYSEFDLAGRWIFGGFQRALHGRLEFEKIEMALERAGGEDLWWEALLQTGRDSGWVRLTWVCGGERRDEILSPQQESGWTLTIPLADGESLRIEGALGKSAQSIDLVAFADAVRGSLPAKRREWSQATLT
jgi:UDP-GlcNAc:undecaprenyl-phosphate/decaprenyl-phosphate GlcNAc-1-phosphate transferase